MVEFEVTPQKRGLARAQRRRQTAIEDLLWRELRARRLCGAKFKRQVPLGPYIVDFVCLEARLIVEVDGPVHNRATQRERDLRRDAWFGERGFSVVRIRAC
jgi:very-short-patch-repair endonuclease